MRDDVVTTYATNDAAAGVRSVRLQPDRHGGGQPDRAGSDQPKGRDSLEPWQFFVLAALGCATAALFASRGQGITQIILLTVLMGATALVGIAALRMLRPLVSAQEERTVMIGQRTRAALEREKMLALRAIKELEFDRAMGKLSDADWHEMSGRLRARAGRLMKQLDAGASYRQQIERDLQKRIGARVAPPATAARACASCNTDNDADARFCKRCGQEL